MKKLLILPLLCTFFLRSSEVDIKEEPKKEEAAPKVVSPKFAVIVITNGSYAGVLTTLKELMPHLEIGGYLVIDRFGNRQKMAALADYVMMDAAKGIIEKHEKDMMVWKKEN